MQVHEPIWKWRAQRDKERHRHDFALCSFQFLCNSNSGRKKKTAKTHFYAKLFTFCWVENIKTPKHQNSSLEVSTSSRWGKQMHLIKCHFHEFRFNIQMRRQKKSLASGRRERSNFQRIQFRFTTWCSWCWCPSHILIIPGFFWTGGSKGESGRKIFRQNSTQPSSNLQNTTNAFYCGSQISNPRWFLLFSFAAPKIRFAKMKFDFEWFQPAFEFEFEKEPSTSANERRGKIAREWNNQHNRSF